MSSIKYGQVYVQPTTEAREIPCPFPEKDPEELITIKVKHLRQLIRLEYAILGALIDGQRVIPGDILTVYEEIGALRELEG